MRSRNVAILIVVVVIAVGSLLAVVLTRTTPHLGLDLRGGANVVLKPVHPVDKATLDETVSIIRNRVDGLGVSEPSITEQGGNINVELPGVRSEQRAVQLVGQTALLTFRPVVQQGTTAPLTTTPPQGDVNKPVVYADQTGVRYQLAAVPTYSGVQMTGQIIKSASATIDQQTGQWIVQFTVKSSASGAFDQLAAANYQKQVAIALDNLVESAPVFQTQAFHGTGQITGNFSQSQAQNLALQLQYGSLPVQLTKQTVQTVSASLGSSSLKAGLVAGVGGLLLVMLYIIFYYRALGIVALLGLVLTGMLLYPVLAYLGKTSGLALSLAGVTGIIVSIGVTVDSYIVYFERLKDEIRSGKSVRSSVDRGFKRAFRTIVAADLVSLIGAAVLYWLSVGAVRGFAFTLGLSTLLDIATSYFFTRPLVIVLGRNRLFTDAPLMGVARGLAAPRRTPAPVGAGR